MGDDGTALTDHDYETILSYCRLPIPSSRRSLRRQAEAVLADKLCKCIHGTKLPPKAGPASDGRSLTKSYSDGRALPKSRGDDRAMHKAAARRRCVAMVAATRKRGRMRKFQCDHRQSVKLKRKSSGSRQSPVKKRSSRASDDWVLRLETSGKG